VFDRNLQTPRSDNANAPSSGTMAHQIIVNDRKAQRPWALVGITCDRVPFAGRTGRRMPRGAVAGCCNCRRPRCIVRLETLPVAHHSGYPARARVQRGLRCESEIRRPAGGAVRQCRAKSIGIADLVARITEWRPSIGGQSAPRPARVPPSLLWRACENSNPG